VAANPDRSANQVKWPQILVCIIPLWLQGIGRRRQPIGWTPHSSSTPIQDMRVDRGCRHISAALEFLDGPDVVAILQEVGSKGDGESCGSLQALEYPLLGPADYGPLQTPES